jgi:uncharacterized protein YpmS
MNWWQILLVILATINFITLMWVVISFIIFIKKEYKSYQNWTSYVETGKDKN